MTYLMRNGTESQQQRSHGEDTSDDSSAPNKLLVSIQPNVRNVQVSPGYVVEGTKSNFYNAPNSICLAGEWLFNQSPIKDDQFTFEDLTGISSAFPEVSDGSETPVLTMSQLGSSILQSGAFGGPGVDHLAESETGQSDQNNFPSSLLDTVTATTVSEKICVPTSEHAAEIIGKNGK